MEKESWRIIIESVTEIKSTFMQPKEGFGL